MLDSTCIFHVDKKRWRFGHRKPPKAQALVTLEDAYAVLLTQSCQKACDISSESGSEDETDIDFSLTVIHNAQLVELLLCTLYSCTEPLYRQRKLHRAERHAVASGLWGNAALTRRGELASCSSSTRYLID